MRLNTSHLLMYSFFYVLLTLTGCNSSSPSTPSPSKQLSVPMLATARQKARELHPDALVVSVEGRRQDGKLLQTPTDTDLWRFKVDTSTGAQGYRSWGVQYNGAWTTQTVEQPTLGFYVTDLAQVPMDVTEAWQLVAQAGHEIPFNVWEMYYPLHPDYYQQAFFIFRTPTAVISVNAATRKVTVDRQSSKHYPFCDC